MAHDFVHKMRARKPVNPKLYFMEAKTDDIVSKRIVKIGISVNAGSRLKQIQTGCPFPVELIKTSRRTVCAGEAERFLHGALKDYRTSGEWFALPTEVMNTLLTFMDCFMDWRNEWDIVWRNCHWDCAPIAQHPAVTVEETALRRGDNALLTALNTIRLPKFDGNPSEWDKAFEVA